MMAIVVDEDERRSLLWKGVDDPVCGPGEVLVDIHTTSVNRADLLQRAGNYPPPEGAPPYMGLEMAGEIRETGPGVTVWKAGDRVCALLAGGGYAEQVAVQQELLLPIPKTWDYVTAGAVPEVFLTAFVNLFMEGDLQQGETVLIHGGASGVGTAAIQLAREAGARVFVTAGTEAKAARCIELGAERAIHYPTEDFVEVLREAGGADLILDIVGGAYFERNIRALRLKGRLVLLALLDGATAQIPIGQVLGKRLRVIGSLLRSRSLAEKTEIMERFRGEAWPLLVEEKVAPVIHRVMGIEEAEAAQGILERNENVGKVVMKVRS